MPTTSSFVIRKSERLGIRMNLQTFLFALGVSLYLKVTSEEKENYRGLQTSGGRTIWETKTTASFELEVILKMGMSTKYDEIPQRKSTTAMDYFKLGPYTRNDARNGITCSRMYRIFCCSYIKYRTACGIVSTCIPNCIKGRWRTSYESIPSSAKMHVNDCDTMQPRNVLLYSYVFNYLWINYSQAIRVKMRRLCRHSDVWIQL